ncbi:MAG: succinate--CoA ligase subunit beta, partial [Dehalococcoidia bacterium]|nr:succinate--CoA ligase subunit beta [Dehalococcoidia bacterium]
MKIHEFMAKAILAEHGVAVPKGGVASTSDEAREIAARLGCRVAVKAQILAGGRGKAGGIKMASTPAKAAEAASQ